jgi:plasmid replication initiation protein
VTVQVDKLRELTTGVNTYPQFTEYRRSVLKPAVDELNSLDFDITYKENKLGRSVDSVEFHITSKAKKSAMQLALPLDSGKLPKASMPQLTALEGKVSVRLHKLQLTEAQIKQVIVVLASDVKQLEKLLKATYPLLTDYESRSRHFDNIGASTVALLKTTFPLLYKNV